MIYFRPHDGRSLRCNAYARHLNVLVVPLFPLWIIGAFCVKDGKKAEKLCSKDTLIHVRTDGARRIVSTIYSLPCLALDPPFRATPCTLIGTLH
ncbi:hypothetical protein DMN91_004000 [Ooceraea biroi]|uniref:Uncharacterized protein n=1 Tax=Ooceraea biroi TaxID=2015173 RepID=A0A3L8DU26_OOCBI|nr:hypothetical protein DMN91_004000 [Ooceraea biroi]